jgi:exodeoxyribonuclease VII small subunit
LLSKVAEPDEDIPNMTYEAALGELERTVHQLGREQEDLAQSVRAFERGLALARRCSELLDSAEQRLTAMAPAERQAGT